MQAKEEHRHADALGVARGRPRARIAVAIKPADLADNGVFVCVDDDDDGGGGIEQMRACFDGLRAGG